MSIIKAGKILINGSTNVFGGFVYSASFNHEYGQSPSTLNLSVISKSKEYIPVQLSATIPYSIKIGDEITLKMYATDWSISDGTDGRTLSIVFVDGRIKMNRIWVALVDFPCGRSTLVSPSSRFEGLSNPSIADNPNIILLGGKFNPSAEQINQFTGVKEGTSPTLTSPTNPSNGEQLFLSYSYDALREKSPITLPVIPNSTNIFRLNTEATLSEVFSQFCVAYGFTWYWDYDTDTPLLLDLRTQIDLDANLSNQLRDIHCLKSISFGESIKDLETQGVVFYNDTSVAVEETQIPQKVIFPVKNFLTAGDFLTFPLISKSTVAGVTVDHIEAAIMATWGEAIYESYIFDKYSGEDIKAAIEIYGYNIISNQTFVQMNSAQQAAVKTKSEKDVFLNDVRLIRVHPINQQNSLKDAHFRMADIIKSKQIGFLFAPYKIEVEGIDVSFINPDFAIDETPGVSAFLEGGKAADSFGLTKFDGTRNSTRIKSRTSLFLHIVTFPNLKFTFDAFDSASPQSSSPTFKQQRDWLSNGHEFDPGGDPTDRFFMIYGQPNTPPVPRVQGLIGYVAANPPDIQSSPSTIADSYSSKYKKSICNIPVVNDLSTSFRILSLSNDGILSPVSAVVNSAVSPTVPFRTFSVEIYGLNTGLNLTPQKGLDSFKVVMGDGGYESSYTLSSKKRIPLDNRIVKQLFI